MYTIATLYPQICEVTSAYGVTKAGPRVQGEPIVLVSRTLHDLLSPTCPGNSSKPSKAHRTTAPRASSLHFGTQRESRTLAMRRWVAALLPTRAIGPSERLQAREPFYDCIHFCLIRSHTDTSAVTSHSSMGRPLYHTPAPRV